MTEYEQAREAIAEYLFNYTDRGDLLRISWGRLAADDPWRIQLLQDAQEFLESISGNGWRVAVVRTEPELPALTKYMRHYRFSVSEAQTDMLNAGFVQEVKR